jgi:hypothetical protein
MVEEVFQTGTEQVDDQDVVQAFLTKVVDVGNPGYTHNSANLFFLFIRRGDINLRHPTRILYVRYSSRS